VIIISKYITNTDQNVALNNTIPFNIVSIPCNKGCVVPITTGVLTLKGSTSNRFARYEVDLQANVAIPEGGAITPLAIAITLNGVAIPDSVAIVTPAAAEDVWHIHTSTTITVPCGCCVSVSAAYVDATEDDATVTPTPSILVRRNASLIVQRTA
jgi:hypothetical protein